MLSERWGRGLLSPEVQQLLEVLCRNCEVTSVQDRVGTSAARVFVDVKFMVHSNSGFRWLLRRVTAETTESS